MRNQRTLDSLYHSVYGDPDFESYDDTEDTLYHHGVLGMSWGKRHGPPYPLDGVDKKIARAEAKRKREKERKMKKLQKAAKKARKLKAKKQKIAEKGDMDKIRKNADLFSNEELAYLMERDAMKRGLGGEKERSTDEKFELAMKRMGQIADVASKGAQVFSALKQGAEMVSAFHDVKVKELTKEGKHLENVGKEFDLRFKRDPEEAFNYLDKEMGGKKYKGERDTKESKLEDKANRAVRREEAENKIQGVKDREKLAKESEKQAKAQEKAEKKAEKDFKKDQKGYEKGLEGLESLFEKKKAADKKEYLKRLGVTDEIASKPAVSIHDSDISSGKDFVQNFEFQKWYASDFQDSVAKKKKTVADFIDAPTVREWSQRQAENRGKQTYSNYPGRDDAIDPLIAKPMAMRTSSIEPQKLESARKTVSSFLDSPEVKTMSSKIPKPVDGGIHGGGIQVPGSFDDYISPYQSVKKSNSQWTDRTKDTMWTLKAALAQPSKYTEAPNETARKWANEYANAAQKKQSYAAVPKNAYRDKHTVDIQRAQSKKLLEQWAKEAREREAANKSKYKLRRARYTKGVNDVDYQELRSIASALYNHDLDRARARKSGSEQYLISPKVAQSEYRSLTPDQRAIVDRLWNSWSKRIDI